MLFISSSKHFSFLRYLCFLPDFFGFAGKRLDKKAKVILKIYDALKWNTHNYNKHTARYLRKSNQAMKLGLFVEYSVRNIFFKNHAENKAGIIVPHLFLFLKNFLIEVNANG